MKSPICYFGGKSGMAPWLASILPPAETYMEPFFGSGALYFALHPGRYRHWILNDRDRAVSTFFRVLRDRCEDLERVCLLTPHSRADFEDAGSTPPLSDSLDDLEIARRFWVRINQSFGKTTHLQTGWTITTSRSQATAASILSRLGRFGPAAERLLGASIECCDGVDLIARLATSTTVIYADPPYLDSTRKSYGKSRGYGLDMYRPEDHERLAEVLNRTAATALLSGYHSPLYDRLYQDWHRVERQVTAYSSQSRGVGSRPGRVEVLWSNRDLMGQQRLPLDAGEPGP